MRKTILSVGLVAAVALTAIPLTACESLASELLDCVSSATAGDVMEFSMSANARAAYMGQAESTSSKVEGVISEKTQEADLYLSANNGQNKTYGITFVRGNAMYSVTKEASVVTKLQYEQLLKDLAEGKELLVYSGSDDSVEIGEISGDLGGLDMNYLTMAKFSQIENKIMKNFMLLGGVEATKTEQGYEITYDLENGISALFDECKPIAKALDKNKDMTVSELLDGPGKKLTDKLLKDVTAEEIVSIWDETPSEFRDEIPEAKAGETLADYLRRLMKTEIDGEVAGEESVEDALEDLGIEKLRSETYESMLADAQEDIKGNVAALIFADMGIAGINQSSVTVKYLFDETKKLTDMNAEVLGSGEIMGITISSSVNMTMKYDSEKTITDISKFYRYNGEKWADQKKGTIFTISVDQIIIDEQGVRNEVYTNHEVTVMAVIKNEKLTVTMKSDTAPWMNNEHTYDLDQSEYYYEIPYGGVSIFLHDTNDNGDYDLLFITVSIYYSRDPEYVQVGDYSRVWQYGDTDISNFQYEKKSVLIGG